jgi:hypothetical protein
MTVMIAGRYTRQLRMLTAARPSAMTNRDAQREAA